MDMRLLSFWANARRSISTSSRFSLLITTQRATPVPSSILITSTLHLLLSSIALAPVPALAPAPTPPCSLTTNQTHPILFQVPPSTRRPPGRPKNRRIRNRSETAENDPIKQQKCGRCEKVGHKRSTCQEPINTV